MKSNKVTKDQNGLVSIMIASVLMIIMALITLGFTRAVQNEQRQAVDNQLSKQAFYAAESGINIAASTPGFPGNLKDTCDVSNYNDGEIVAGNSDVTFTCLLINPTPDDIVFGNDSITTNKSKVVPIRPSAAPASIIFQWNDANSDGRQSACSSASTVLDFDQNAAGWNKIAPLRLDLIRIPTGALSRDILLNNQFSAIFYPCDNSGLTQVNIATATGSANVGKIIPVNCTNTGEYECQIEIIGLNTAATQEYYARFNALYSEINVRITATDVAGNRTLFSNAQAVVDSTGKAVDVFRRLQARVPLYETYVTPSASIQTLDDICKLYTVQPTVVVDGCD